MVDLAKGEADLAVRVLSSGTGPPEHLVGTRVAPLMLANYVARHHAEPAPERAQRWLGYSDMRVVRPLVAAGSYPDMPVWGSFSSLDLVTEAVRAGLGVGLLPTYVGDADPALVRMPSPDLREAASIWLLHHPDLRGNLRVKAAREAVRAAFSADQDLFLGRCADAPPGSAGAPR
jgi:DNA-binding transcriptional LysR family regulator